MLSENLPEVSVPFGQMSIVSVLASGKQLTATLNPNGRPIQSVVFVALDQDPNNLADFDFVIVIPQQQISSDDCQRLCHQELHRFHV